MKIEIEEDLSLESLNEKHVQPIFLLALRNKLHIREWFPWVDLMETSEFMANYIKASTLRCEAGTEHAFVILKGEEVVGRIGLHRIDLQNRVGEIGYWIGEEYQGNGLITKACGGLIAYAFDTLLLNRIEIRCGMTNTKSQKIAERLGFTLEGISRQAYFVRDAFFDLKVYSMLKSEWGK